MEMSGEELINAPRTVVWDALNDPEILRQAIPGCEEVVKDGDTSFAAKVKVKVGPVKATFKGQVTLSNMDAPNGYTITGEGKGGAAGFGKGGADIKLTETDGGTLLSYDVRASVGGKMAQIGSRLIDSTAKKLAGEFFAKFNELVSQPAEAEAPLLEDAPVQEPDTAAQTSVPQSDGAISQDQSAPMSASDTSDKPGWMKPSFLIPAAIAIVAVIYFLTKA
ncbi:MAG: carbon monoxide dehydrogenase subunit G [Sneathiella sp.]|jgi:carbon monoxide dehydrogenase subunit G